MKALVLLVIMVASLSSMAHSTKPVTMHCGSDGNKNQFAMDFVSQWAAHYSGDGKTVFWKENITSVQFTPPLEVAASRRWLTVTMADGTTFTGVVINKVLQESLRRIKEGTLNGPYTRHQDKELPVCYLMDE